MSQQMRVGLVQHDPTVGDTEGNADRLGEGIGKAAAAGADLVVTPELGIPGYPPRDLLHRDGFRRNQRRVLESLAERTASGPAVIVGAVGPTKASAGAPLQNLAYVLSEGGIETRYAKRLLPTYDVFDEHRYFEPGSGPLTVDVGETTVGVSICEDAWHDVTLGGKRRHGSDPLGDLADAGADLVVTLSASPFSLGKPARRVDRFGRHASRTGLPVVFVNQVGGNDDLIFDGNSMVVSPEGSVVHSLPAFETATAVVDPFTDPATEEGRTENRTGQARAALSLGIRDYLRKTGFSEVLIGLSGGIDSSVTAGLAVDALGAEHVGGISIPSSVTDQQSTDDARAVAENLGIDFEVVPIDEATSELGRSIQHGTGTEVAGLAAENIQARVRGNVLMTLANARDALVLTPDNKSESAVGYCTLYGDTVGALAPLGDCYKSLVYELADHLNEQPPVGSEPVIPQRVIDKEPTAELSEGQTDEDDLPPYDQLDPVLEGYIQGRKTAAQLREEFQDPVVDEALSRIARSEFKRRQSPPPLRITKKAFGRGWKYPIAACYDDVTER